MSEKNDLKPAGVSASVADRQNGSIEYLVLVCLVASLGGLLFGFDTAVISGTVERVREQFGLNELMEGWFTSSALVGCVFGAVIAGALGDRFGRKPVLIGAAIFFLDRKSVV